MKGKTHDLNHDLTFSAHTINCVCHSVRSMFRVLAMFNFGSGFSSAVSAEINCLSVLNPIKGGKADDKPRFYASTKKMT